MNVGVNVASIGGANIGYESKSPASDPPEVKSVNEALDYLLLAASPHKKGIVIVVDEFDRLQYDSCHSKFATLVKQISDQAAPIKFIFCGISGSVEALFREHESVFRSIHSELVERLALNARLEIIDDASGALQIGIPDGFKYRIAQISDGFPSFVHLLADKMFSAAFEANKDRVDSLIYKTGLQVALRSVEFSLKKRYEDALHKNTKKYEHVIWSVASDHNLDSNVETIWKNYISIMETIGENSLARQNVNTKLNQLTTESYGRLLVKPRRSNYSFDEKMMRGYARLRAEDSGCSLGKENADLVRM
ncbi:MAG: hypothetical protein BGP06_13590 [Rhizobiales bacterium 65-9]|nr:MAG: hypothetical protein BGP06_13590 [Rhizobiales bacterium 65-9]